MAPMAAKAPQTDHRKSGCFSKTKLCRFHILGLCARGAECQFAHSKDEMMKLPDFTRTKLCKTLRETGACDDPSCGFAHSVDELRSLATMFAKTKMCHFFKMGHCSMGGNCNFAHDPAELRGAVPVPKNWSEETLRYLREYRSPEEAFVGKAGVPWLGKPTDFSNAPMTPSKSPTLEALPQVALAEALIPPVLPSFSVGLGGSIPPSPDLVAQMSVPPPMPGMCLPLELAGILNMSAPFAAAPGSQLGEDLMHPAHGLPVAKSGQVGPATPKKNLTKIPKKAGADGGKSAMKTAMAGKAPGSRTTRPGEMVKGVETNTADAFAVAKPPGLLSDLGKHTAKAKAKSGLGVPMPVAALTDSPIYLFQAEPDRPGSFKAVSSASESQHSAVIIGQIRDPSGGANADGDDAEGPGSCVDMHDAAPEMGTENIDAIGAADFRQDWQVKNTFLSFGPPARPIRTVRTCDGALSSLAEASDDE